MIPSDSNDRKMISDGLIVTLDLTTDEVEKLKESASYYGDKTLEDFITNLCRNRITGRGMIGN